MRSSSNTALDLGLSFVVVVLSAAMAHASATLLLEEPYGGLLRILYSHGTPAVYLSGVCAETPILLRPCAPGELGAVINELPESVTTIGWQFR